MAGRRAGRTDEVGRLEPAGPMRWGGWNRPGSLRPAAPNWLPFRNGEPRRRWRLAGLDPQVTTPGRGPTAIRLVGAPPLGTGSGGITPR